MSETPPPNESGLKLRVPLWILMQTCPHTGDPLVYTGTTREQVLQWMAEDGYRNFIADLPDDDTRRGAWDAMSLEGKALAYAIQRCELSPTDTVIDDLVWKTQDLVVDVLDLKPHQEGTSPHDR